MTKSDTATSSRLYLLEKQGQNFADTQSYIAPVPCTRWVLLHYHIFKNAGTTIEYVLTRAFRDKFATLHGPKPDSILTTAEVQSFLLQHPPIVAISSHHLRYPKPSIPDVIVFDLCFLRDSLQRLWSTYKYLRSVDPVDELGHAAKRMDVRSFFNLVIREHPEIVNDVQVNILANRGVYTRPPAATDLAAALSILPQMSVVGVVGPFFDESLVAAEYFLRPAFPALQFQYVKQNVTATDGDTGLCPEAQLREELGERIYHQLKCLNQLDCELLSYAKEEVLRRFALVPDCRERLADFRKRCAVLCAVHQTLERDGILNAVESR